MGKVRLRYLLQKPSRHGKERFYLRLPGRPMIRLPIDSLDDPNLGLAYALALTGERLETPCRRSTPHATDAPVPPIPGSLRALCVRYFDHLARDPQLSEITKRTRRRHLEEVCREPLKIGGTVAMGDVPVSRFSTAHVVVLADRKMKTPEAANARRKALVALFRWAIQRRLAENNPAALTVAIKTHSDGHPPWAKEHIDRFIETHPIGTKAHLAMSLLLYTGQRRADVVRFGKQHIKDNELHFVQQKNERRMHKKMCLPILPALQEVLALIPRDHLTFLVTEYGRPFSPAGFGNWFRDRCDEAGLKGLSAHGLRKTLQIIGAEMGLTDRELMAIAGHESTQETSRYTKKRDRDLLAKSGMAKLSEVRFKNKNVPP